MKFTTSKNGPPFLLAISLAVAVACGTGNSGSQDVEPSAPASTATSQPAPPPSASSSATHAPRSSATPPPTSVESDPLDQIERSIAERLQLFYGWETDFNQRTINLTEINVLLPRDRIAPIDDPTFAQVSDPLSYMKAREPVISLEINGDARAYPLAMLMWHEIVNDTVGGVPVTITFCPLCNSALVFERSVAGQELTFGTTGALRNSDLVMWDRLTKSWWQQLTGEAIAGHYAGQRTRLQVLPSGVVAWESFTAAYPGGKVLERKFDERGFPIRRYDLPPYAGYDSVDNTSPFAYDGPIDGRLPAAARVLAIQHEGASVAYPSAYLRENSVLSANVGDLAFVAMFDPGTLSAFVDQMENPQVSGSVTVFNRLVDGQLMEFEWVNGAVRDAVTGSAWSFTGRAISGPLAGTQLEPVVYGEYFWFAWAVFQPDTELRGVN